MNSLIHLLHSILPISKEEQLLIHENIVLETYNKGQQHCSEGKICKKLSFIEEGIFKVEEANADGNEFIKYFACQGHFAVDLDSFFNQIPSKENITALTACKIITITPTNFELFEEKVTNFSKIIATLKEKALLEKYKVKSEMLVDDAETRYLKFVKRHPNVVQQISQKLIASHLGISQFTLSRIRARV